MTAAIESDGTVVQLDRKAEPRTIITEADVQDPKLLARLIQELQRQVAELRSRFAPRVTYFRDVPITDDGGTVLFRFEHGFGTRVNWSVVRWESTDAATEQLLEDPETDENTLVLYSFLTGTATIRVEEAG